MFLPDFPLCSYYEENTLEEGINVVFLSEGNVSEKLFYKTLFCKGGKFADIDGYNFKEMKKTDFDVGITEPVLLVKKGKEKFESDPNIDISRDKLVVTFDLDKLTEKDIEKLIDEKTNYLIYGFTNPKFELVQLISAKAPIKGLEKSYYKAGFPNELLEDAYSVVAGKNSKGKPGAKFAAKNVCNILANFDYDSNDIRIEDKFFSSVPMILRAINEKKLQDFKQDFKKKGGKP